MPSALMCSAHGGTHPIFCCLWSVAALLVTRRRTEGGKDVVYPVHAVAFHPQAGTFATGGGDGAVSIWDGDHKKRIFQISAYPTSVASLAFSADGSSMAVAASYAYEQGDQPHPPEAIYVRRMLESEVKPKAKRQQLPAGAA